MLKQSIIFDQSSMRILWFEAILFSVVFGVAYRSWIVSVVLLSVLLILLRAQGKAIYAIGILSLLWGIIIAGIAFEVVGWGWSLATGGLVFSIGLRFHWRELKTDLSKDFDRNPNANWYLKRFNLN